MEEPERVWTKRKVGDPRVPRSEETYLKEVNFSCRPNSEAPILQLKKEKRS